MKKVDMIAKQISEYERAHGEPLDPETILLAKAMAAMCDRFEDLGAREAAEGYAQREAATFDKLNAPKWTDLLYKCYLKGYSASGSARVAH